MTYLNYLSFEVQIPLKWEESEEDYGIVVKTLSSVYSVLNDFYLKLKYII